MLASIWGAHRPWPELYLPRQDEKKVGLVGRYTFLAITDGSNWTTAATGVPSNIVTNPILQFVDFNNPVSARYFRFMIEAVADITSRIDSGIPYISDKGKKRG